MPLLGTGAMPDGRFTIKSITDYLAILTVFQTCEYRGLDVWDFLVSGEANFEHVR
jgi:hypothetical protein